MPAQSGWSPVQFKGERPKMRKLDLSSMFSKSLRSRFGLVSGRDPAGICRLHPQSTSAPQELLTAHPTVNSMLLNPLSRNFPLQIMFRQKQYGESHANIFLSCA
jgi:hypothetical protein